MACPTMIQVTNISPRATEQHMRELFSYLGDVIEAKVYPEDELRPDIPSKVCFVNFSNKDSVLTALHLTNTIFIDRALIVARSRYSSIPGEIDAMSLAAPAVAIANQSKPVGHTAPLLPTPPTVTSVLGAAGIVPTAPTVPQIPQPSSLISLMGTVVPQPPPLTGNVDPTKIEEIRRTIYVGNLNSSLTAEQILTFFQPCGEIKYVRMAGDETQPTRFAFVEFALSESVPIALQYNGAMFGDRPIKVNHSKNAIVKPQGPSPSETKREVEEALRKVREANLALLEQKLPAAPEAVVVGSTAAVKEKESSSSKKRTRSRSRSHSRSRKQIPEPTSDTKSRERKRYRSRSRDRYRKRSRSRSPYYRSSRRSRSPRYRRGRSRSRSRSPRRGYRDYRRRSRSRSRSPYERRRDRDRERRRSRDRDRDRDRDSRRDRRRSPRRRSPSTSPDRTPPKKSKSSRKKDRSASRSPSPSRHSSSRSSKKSKKRRHKRRSPSPTPSPSPQPSGDDYEGNGDRGRNRASSAGESPSPPPQRDDDSDAGRGSGGVGSDMDEGREGSDRSPSRSPEKIDSDSSYD